MKKALICTLVMLLVLSMVSAFAADYTTNTGDAIKKGNSGKYAYKSKGGSYANYYIIDFDANYVYSFTDGNGSGTCERVKIAYGTLNDVLVITYHDGGDEWSYGLHFKWKNQPDQLILQEESGYEVNLYPTNLDAAMKIKNSKTVKDY